MSIRKKLKRKGNVKKQLNTQSGNKYFDTVSDLYYSGFCLTDNCKFSFYYIDDKFIIDNNIDAGILASFSFTENDFVMEIDKTLLLTPSKGMKRVCFEIEDSPYKFVDRELFNIVIQNNPRCAFHPLITYFDFPVNDLLVVLSEKFGKPVAVLKLEKE